HPPCLLRGIQRRAQRHRSRKTDQALAAREETRAHPKDEPAIPRLERKFSKIKRRGLFAPTETVIGSNFLPRSLHCGPPRARPYGRDDNFSWFIASPFLSSRA